MTGLRPSSVASPRTIGKDAAVVRGGRSATLRGVAGILPRWKGVAGAKARLRGKPFPPLIAWKTKNKQGRKKMRTISGTLRRRSPQWDRIIDGDVIHQGKPG